MKRLTFQVAAAARILAVVLLAVVLVVVLAVVLVVVVVVVALTGATAGRYLEALPQYPPNSSVTLSLARVKPLAKAQQIFKMTALFLMESIALV